MKLHTEDFKRFIIRGARFLTRGIIIDLYSYLSYDQAFNYQDKNTIVIHCTN